MRISDWSSDVCSSDLQRHKRDGEQQACARNQGVSLYASPGEAIGDPTAKPQAESEGDGAGDAVVHRHFLKRHALDAHEKGRNPGCHRMRSEEHTSELQSLMRISYAVFCLKKKNNIINNT